MTPNGSGLAPEASGELEPAVRRFGRRRKPGSRRTRTRLPGGRASRRSRLRRRCPRGPGGGGPRIEGAGDEQEDMQSWRPASTEETSWALSHRRASVRASAADVEALDRAGELDELPSGPAGSRGITERLGHFHVVAHFRRFTSSNMLFVNRGHARPLCVRFDVRHVPAVVMDVRWIVPTQRRDFALPPRPSPPGP